MTSPAALLAAHNLSPKKQYGQNFLKDPSTARMIIDRIRLSADDVVLEIGAGLGALTLPAAGRVRRVVAVEKDPQLATVLAQELATQGIDNVEIRNADILSVDLRKISRDAGRKLVVLGNLPYNISSQVVLALMDARDAVDRAALMFQKEVAQRLSAPPGSKDYGRLTVMLQYAAEVKKLASVAAHLFLPRPKVDSEVIGVRFKKTIEDPAKDEGLLSAVVKAAFSTRRKTLKNALSRLAPAVDEETIKSALERAGIDLARRAESLTVAEFVRLSNEFGEAREGGAQVSGVGCQAPESLS
jgi:16S rRNA (adenine1518-N6/adenine1519-N6)-dimethyltransferase